MATQDSCVSPAPYFKVHDGKMEDFKKLCVQMVQKTEEDLLNLENFGKRSLFEIKERLEEMGLGLGLTIDQEVFEAEKSKRGERIASQ